MAGAILIGCIASLTALSVVLLATVMKDNDTHKLPGPGGVLSPPCPPSGPGLDDALLLCRCRHVRLAHDDGDGVCGCGCPTWQPT